MSPQPQFPSIRGMSPRLRAKGLAALREMNRQNQASPYLKEHRAMKNAPHQSHFDIAVLGKSEGPVVAYRRTQEIDGFVNSIDPATPPASGDRWSVYQWDDAQNSWQWQGDMVNEDIARRTAIALAGTDQPYAW